MTKFHDLGWQCPECYGFRVTSFARMPHDRQKYQCQECGNQWSVTADELRSYSMQDAE